MVDVSEVRARLGTALRRRWGSDVQVGDVRFPTVGGSSRTILFETIERGRTRWLVSREETYNEPNSPFLSPHDQFRTMRVAHAYGVRVPEPLFKYDDQDPFDRGYVVAFVKGETFPRTLQTSPEFALARETILRDCGEVLACLHAIPCGELEFLADWPDSQDPLAAQRKRFDSYAEAHPAIELGLRWLECNRPPPRSPVLVHGDFRTGNLMVDPTGLAAVLDWECCHHGSPAEDLGWFCARSWRFGRTDLPAGGFGSRESLLAAYEAAGGNPVLRDEVRYWEIFALVRWTVLSIMQAHGHVSGRRRGLVFAACGRNASMTEYDLLMTIRNSLD